TVLFVAKVDDGSRRKAVKSAYDRAVAQAELLAAATGHKTGELITLRASDIPPSGPDESGRAYMTAYGAFAASGMDIFTGDEAQSPSAGELKFNTRVDVEFALLK